MMILIAMVMTILMITKIIMMMLRNEDLMRNDPINVSVDGTIVKRCVIDGSYLPRRVVWDKVSKYEEIICRYQCFALTTKSYYNL